MPDFRIRPRLSGGQPNIEGRLTDLPTPADEYELQITVAPSRFQVGDSALVTFTATRNGAPYGNVPVAVLIDNPLVGDVPADILLASDGRATFTFVGEAEGDAGLRGRLDVDDLEVFSPTAPIEVFAITPPINYNMQGWGRVVMTCENPFANALTPRLERMSHEEQLRTYGNDRGLEYATAFENETVVFLPKVLQE